MTPPRAAVRGRGRPKNGPSRDVRRDEILDAALRVIRRDGPQASMDAIAAEAMITKPMIYSHFGDKAGLATAIGSHIAAELAKQMGGGAGARTFEAQVHHMVTAFVDFVDHDPDLFAFLLHPPSGKHASEIRQLQDTLALGLAPLLRAPAVDRGFSAESSVVFAYGAIGLTYAPVHWWATSGRDDMSKEQLVDHVSRMVVAALTIDA